MYISQYCRVSVSHASHKAANFLSSMHADARLANVAEYPHLMRSLYIPSSLGHVPRDTKRET